MMNIERAIEMHPLMSLLINLTEMALSEKLTMLQVKRISSELIRLQTNDPAAYHLNPANKTIIIIDHAIKAIIKSLLGHMVQVFQDYINADEAFKVLAAANEPFKKTRRRLPPQAEDELSDWLRINSKHPYMNENDINAFCSKYTGTIEPDQVRIFLTNSRRKMSDGVRKRSRTNPNPT